MKTPKRVSIKFLFNKMCLLLTPNASPALMQNGSSPYRSILGRCGHTPKLGHLVTLANLTR